MHKNVGSILYIVAQKCRQYTLHEPRTARGTWSGETDRSSQSHESQLSYFEPKANRNEVFHRHFEFEYSPSRCFSLFYLQAASQTHAFDAGDTMWRPSSSWVGHKTRSLLFVLRPKSTRTQAQLHVHWASKSTWTWLQLFSQTARLSFDLLSIPIPASRARSRSSADIDHARPTTWQLVVLVPRSTETHVVKPMAISRNGLDWVAISCQLWRNRTGPVAMGNL